MQRLFGFELPTSATIVSVAVALVLLYQGVLKSLVETYSGLASARKDKIADEVAEHAKTKEKLKTVEGAYAVALIEIDTSRRIRIEHNERIKMLEQELAVARGLTPPDVHRTEA